MDLSREMSDEEIENLIGEEASRLMQEEPISIRERLMLEARVFNSLRKLDALQELLDDPEISEIMVNGPKHIFYEKAGRVHAWNQAFASEEKMQDVIQQIVGRHNRVVNLSNPIVDTRLADGSRVNIVLAPVSLDGSTITIRKFPEKPLDMQTLIQKGALPEDAAEFLKMLVRAKYNLLISGGTSSGKTTFLNALSQYIPEDERVITIEDSAELQIQGIKNLVRLETRNANMEGVQPVTIRENELSIIEYGFENDLMQPMPPAARSDKKIAVIGSGPAGLSAAYYLNRRGHHVTVLEKDPLPGGLLTYGIPEMKLPKQIVARRISLMEREGVSFRTNCCAGQQISPEELAAQFDLVIFCCGAQQPRPLPFAEAGGVFYALDYLHASAQSLLEKTEPAVTASGKHVVLVGAGDSASDCISVALRQGCRSITQLIRKPRTGQTEKRDHAHEEAEAVFGMDIRRYETQIDRLVCGDDGAVNAVLLQGSEEQIPCDLLLLASGFSGCERASLDVYEAVRQSGAPVLTAGDMASGASLVVLAIASGKQAAAQADASLMGYTNIL